VKMRRGGGGRAELLLLFVMTLAQQAWEIGWE
jgi:hypothetical protein